MSGDPRAATGFGGGADAYERGRPSSYPADAIDTVVHGLGLTRASTVLDLAAGTGKLARVLVPLVGRVIAVEPSQAKLAQLREKVPDVEARTGTAEAIPLEGDSVDAVFVGEAFHWFRVPRACAEIARALKPSGSLVVAWQRARWTEQRHSWLEAFDALVRPYRQTGQLYPAGYDDWKLHLEETGLFGPLTRTEADYDHDISAHDFVALVESWSWIANLPDERRTNVLAAVRELLGEQRELTLCYRTAIYSTRLA